MAARYASKFGAEYDLNLPECTLVERNINTWHDTTSTPMAHSHSYEELPKSPSPAEQVEVAVEAAVEAASTEVAAGRGTWAAGATASRLLARAASISAIRAFTRQCRIRSNISSFV